MPLQTGPSFIDNPLDRSHLYRDDDGWIEQQRASASVRIVVIAGDKPLHGTVGNPRATALFAPDEAERLAPGAEEMFLGVHPDGHPVFARLASAPGEAGPGGALGHNDLRAIALQGLLPDSEISILAMARSMLAWHESHRFCSRCGAQSAMVLGGFRRDCTSCGAQHFPRTDPVAITLVSDGSRALIARSARFIPGMYSALAGFIEPGETIEQAVRREIFEESGIRVGRVHYHSSQPWPYPSSLMIGCLAEAETTEITIDPKEIEDAKWVTRAELRAALAGTGSFKAPQPVAIAHHLIRTYAEAGD